MRAIGDRTRAEALVGIPAEHQASLMQALAVMRENLVLACEQPADQQAEITAQSEAVNV